MSLENIMPTTQNTIVATAEASKPSAAVLSQLVHKQQEINALESKTSVAMIELGDQIIAYVQSRYLEFLGMDSKFPFKRLVETAYGEIRKACADARTRAINPSDHVKHAVLARLLPDCRKLPRYINELLLPCVVLGWDEKERSCQPYYVVMDGTRGTTWEKYLPGIVGRIANHETDPAGIRSRDEIKTAIDTAAKIAREAQKTTDAGEQAAAVPGSPATPATAGPAAGEPATAEESAAADTRSDKLTFKELSKLQQTITDAAGKLPINNLAYVLRDILKEHMKQPGDAATFAKEALDRTTAVKLASAISDDVKAIQVLRDTLLTLEKLAPKNVVPATAVPATAVPATAVPATAVPATAVPATAVPATAETTKTKKTR
jgi:hypothetical protein